MNKAIYRYKFIIPAALLLVFLMLSFQTHAGGTKIIIVGSDYGYGNHHSYSGHHNYYRHSNSDRLHNYNRFKRHRISSGDHYYGKRYYKNNYNGYGNHYRYNDRRSYRNRGSYCPY